MKTFSPYTCKLIFSKYHLARLLLFLSVAASFITCKQPISLPPGDPDNGGLYLPENFEALVVADKTGQARHLAINSNGDIYVKLISSETGRAVVALRDTTHDGKADIMHSFWRC